ncbi:MAG: hypothetical protein IKN98_01380 [Bacteroidales bacterium]|nr:hypothetical protein [Bacteroidales bacterium]
MNQEDFDEYIRQVEPSARQSAADWQTAIGLQQVDGLKQNVRLSIDYDISFLERFFCNLLLDEKNELKNRSMLINAPDGWNATDDKPTITDDKPTIILAYLKEKGSCKTAELSALLGLKPTQTKAYLYQLLQEGKIVAHGANKNRTYSLA